LRRLRESDAEDLFAIFSDPKVTRYWGAATWTTLEPAREMIAADLSAVPRTHLRLAVERKADGRLLGTCTLFNFLEASRRAEVGYGLGPFAWGRGYMLESLSALLQYGFEVESASRRSGYRSSNEPSGRILERSDSSRKACCVSAGSATISRHGVLRSRANGGRRACIDD
jgi:RimJ/RimL family protein N-acetyltransferase